MSRCPQLAVACLATMCAVAPGALASDAGDAAVLVKMHPSVSSQASDAAIRRALATGPATDTLPGGWREYRVARPMSLNDARQRLGGTGVAAVETPGTLRASTPNDPLFPQQWALNNASTPGADIGFLPAWKALSGRRPVVVAVVDTGTQLDHPDLAARIWMNPRPGTTVVDGVKLTGDTHGWDFYNNAPLADRGSEDAHGTHVSGIVAAHADNGIGIAGVAPGATIMPLKVLGGHDGSGSTLDAAKAIRYAVNNGARVINGSFGGDAPNQMLCDTIAWAARNGVTFVAAAGNDGRNLDVAPSWPAACAEPSMITVASHGADGRISWFSNRSGSQVDIAAPGENIISTIPGGRYAVKSGTSMAAPMVSGAVAMMYAEDPNATPIQVRSRLVATATPHPALHAHTLSGGTLNVSAALGITPPQPAPSPAPQPVLAPSPSPSPSPSSAPEPVPATPISPPAPFTAIAPAAGARVATHNVTVSWHASTSSTGISAYRVMVNGVRVQETPGTTATVFMAEGVNSWQVEAVDHQGNVTATPTRLVTVTPPAVRAATIRALTVSAGRVTVRWGAARNTSGRVADYEVRVQGRAVRRTRALSSVVAARPGQHIVIVARDAAGTHLAASPAVVVPHVRVGHVVSRAVRGQRISRVRIRSTARQAHVVLAATRGGRTVARGTIRVTRGNQLRVLPSSVARQMGRGTQLRTVTVRVVTGRAS